MFARARRVHVRDWFAEWSRARPEINRAPGRHTTDAIWRTMVRQSLGEDKAFLEWTWDLQKAFDHVDRGLLWQAAGRHGYPKSVLATSLVSYGWGRRFLLTTEVSRMLLSHRGIAAGSPYAPYELALQVAGVIDLVRAWNVAGKPKAFLSIHEDDISVMLECAYGDRWQLP